MRQKHELEKGVICEKCLGTFSKERGYTRVKFEKPVPESSTGVSKSISRMNLCNNCYEEFKKVIEEFTGKSFLDTNNINQKKEELKRLKETMIKSQYEQQNETTFRK